VRVLLPLIVSLRGLALSLGYVALVTGFVDAALADGGLARHGCWLRGWEWLLGDGEEGIKGYIGVYGVIGVSEEDSGGLMEGDLQN